MEATRPRKTAARRAEIVAAAVNLADAEGLEAVSMRRLAEILGIAPMTIYSHVADKDELLDLMRDEVSREMLVPEPLPPGWREALREIAQRTRRAIEAHPWSFDAEPQRPRRRINTMRHVEQSLSVVEMMGIDLKTGGAVLMAVDDYVIGHCLRKRARERLVEAMHQSAPDGEGARADSFDREVEDAIDAGELPRLKLVFGRRGLGRGPLGVPPATEFEAGLEWLLDGIEVMAEG
jgi:AcrR family transcriptional regulator